jgi:hypothetical protein
VKRSVFVGKTLWFLHRVQETVFSPNAHLSFYSLFFLNLERASIFSVFGGLSGFCSKLLRIEIPISHAN